MQYIIATLDAFLGASEVHIMQLWKVEAVNNMQSKLYFDIYMQIADANNLK